MGTEMTKHIITSANAVFLVLLGVIIPSIIVMLNNRKKKRDKAMTELRVAEAEQRAKEAKQLEQEAKELARQEAEAAEEKNRQAAKQAKELCQQKGINIFDYLAATDQTALINFLTVEDFERDWQSKRQLDVWGHANLTPAVNYWDFDKYLRVLHACGGWGIFSPDAQRDAVDSAPTATKKWKLNYSLPMCSSSATGRYDLWELADALVEEVISQIEYQATLYSLNDTLGEIGNILSHLSRDGYRYQSIERAIRRKVIELAEDCESKDPKELLELLNKVSNEVRIDEDCSPEKKIQLHNNVVARIMSIDPYGYAEKLAYYDYVKQWLMDRLGECQTEEQVEELRNRLAKKGEDFAEEINRRLVEIKLSQS